MSKQRCVRTENGHIVQHLVQNFQETETDLKLSITKQELDSNKQETNFSDSDLINPYTALQNIMFK